jgi:hypothetical protein
MLDEDTKKVDRLKGSSALRHVGSVVPQG